MKKISAVLMMLILAAGMVFASKTVTLNSTIAAGTGVTDPGTGNVIGGGDTSGFWLRLAYYTDKNPTLREVSATAETARLTETTSDSNAIDNLTFVFTYAGNSASSGSIADIRVATEGWKGVGSENSTERFPITLTYAKLDSTVDNLAASTTATAGSSKDDTTGETTVSTTFDVSYPSGLISTSKQLAKVTADWTKSDNRKAGTYQATITVTVNGK
ncbi:MAG: hypothetical protein ACI4NM_11135 [Bullifex sp.]